MGRKLPGCPPSGYGPTRDPNFKQHMKNRIMVWMSFGSKLLNSFSMSAIYSFLKYLRYRQTKTSTGNFENI